LDPAGDADQRLRESLREFDVEPRRQNSGAKTAIMIGGFLLPLLGRDFPQLRLAGPALTDRMTGHSDNPVSTAPPERSLGDSNERQEVDRRDELLRQFLAVAADRGYAAMSMATVLQRARLSEQMYSQLYPDQDSGSRAACAAAIDRIAIACAAAIPDGRGEVRSRLETAVHAYLTVLAGHQDEALVLHRDLLAAGSGTRRLNDRHRTMLAEHFTAALGPLDPHTGRLLAAAVTGVVTDRIVHGPSAGTERGWIEILPSLTPEVTAVARAVLPRELEVVEPSRSRRTAQEPPRRRTSGRTARSRIPHCDRPSAIPIVPRRDSSAAVRVTTVACRSMCVRGYPTTGRRAGNRASGRSEHCGSIGARGRAPKTWCTSGHAERRRDVWRRQRRSARPIPPKMPVA
jgi:AcrR family transcriptional regulator